MCTALKCTLSFGGVIYHEQRNSCLPAFTHSLTHGRKRLRREKLLIIVITLSQSSHSSILRISAQLAASAEPMKEWAAASDERSSSTSTGTFLIITIIIIIRSPAAAAAKWWDLNYSQFDRRRHQRRRETDHARTRGRHAAGFLHRKRNVVGAENGISGQKHFRRQRRKRNRSSGSPRSFALWGAQRYRKWWVFPLHFYVNWRQKCWRLKKLKITKKEEEEREFAASETAVCLLSFLALISSWTDKR